MVFMPFKFSSVLLVGLLITMNLGAVDGAQTTTHVRPRHRVIHKAVVHHTLVKRTTTRAGVLHTNAASLVSVNRSTRRATQRIFASPWTEPTYADSTFGDNFDGDDPVVRKAAVDALGPYNGTVVVADPETGRLLTIVNQKLGLKGAFQPCSTVKLVVSMAALREGVVEPTTKVQLSRRYSMDMTFALAKSNNQYFATLGQKLGYDKVAEYTKMFGIGEKAGLDIPGEEPGSVATKTPDSGIGMMTSFGDGIRVTPLELTGIVSSIANGGTMYYLQYPKNQDEASKFVPRVKRELDIQKFIPEVKPGMMGAVEYGTARRASYGNTEQIYGKTGTCTDTVQPGVHLGWFGSYTEVAGKKVAVVVLLTGGRGVAGPIASGIAGGVYQNLSASHYFGDADTVTTKLVSMQK
jgi:cell division protein FtsI/penicillin-binding protein 2